VQGVAITSVNLAEALRYQGDYGRANVLYREALASHHKIGNKLGIVACLEGLAVLARQGGNPQRAARLWGTSEVLRAMIGAALHPNDRADYEQNVAALRSELTPGELSVAWAAGRETPIQDAIAYACDGAV
jgi:hypothetical protein